MKRKLQILLTFGALALNFACGGAATETAKPASAGNQSTASTTAASKPATAAMKNSTPSEANQSLFNAIKAKDKATVKQLMSKESLTTLEAAAQEKKMTVDELLDKEFFVNVTLPAALEQRNEKITGETATVEMKTDQGDWTPSTFVKEGGAWKVSL